MTANREYRARLRKLERDLIAAEKAPGLPARRVRPIQKREMSIGEATAALLEMDTDDEHLDRIENLRRYVKALAGS